MICTGPCNRDQPDTAYYMHTVKGKRCREQPCKLCQAIVRRKRKADDASLTATLSTLQLPVVSLSNSDMDLY